MSGATWSLHDGRFPCVEVEFIARDGQILRRKLLADTGCGASDALFDVVLSEADCLSLGAIPIVEESFTGAVSGTFSLYLTEAQIPKLRWQQCVFAVGVPSDMSLPTPLDGLASFHFLNQFHYGNFGDPERFGLGTV